VSRGVNPSSREGESQTGDWMAGLLTSNIPFAWITWHREVTARHRAKCCNLQNLFQCWMISNPDYYIVDLYISNLFLLFFFFLEIELESETETAPKEWGLINDPPVFYLVSSALFLFSWTLHSWKGFLRTRRYGREDEYKEIESGSSPREIVGFADQ